MNSDNFVNIPILVNIVLTIHTALNRIVHNMKNIFHCTFSWICIIATLLLGMGQPFAWSSHLAGASHQQMDCYTQKASACENENTCCCDEKPTHQDNCASHAKQDVTHANAITGKSVFHVLNAALYQKTCSCGLLTNSNHAVPNSRQIEHVKQQNTKEKQSVLIPIQKTLNLSPFKVNPHYSHQNAVVPRTILIEKVCLRI